MFSTCRSYLKGSGRCWNSTPPQGKTSSVLTSSFRALLVCKSEQRSLYTSYSPAVFYGTLLMASSFCYWKDGTAITKSFLSLSDASRSSPVNSAGIPPTLKCHWNSPCFISEVSGIMLWYLLFHETNNSANKATPIFCTINVTNIWGNTF